MVANTWYTPKPLPRAGVWQARNPRDKHDVGVVSPNYGLEHLTYLLKLDRYRHVRVNRLPLYRYLGKGGFWDKAPVLVPSGCSLVHTFNMTPVNGPPFVVSFEMELPHLLGKSAEWQIAATYRILSSTRCRAILALSDTARDLGKAKFERLGIPEISRKITTFRGGVIPAMGSSESSKEESRAPLKLMFVGADGMRKGIIPLLDAIDALRSRGMSIELTVVSSLVSGSYVTDAKSLEELIQLTRNRLSGSEWITYHPMLPYLEVRRLMAQHDLLLLPTLDDTLGWVVVEAGMEGVATIATNSYALPELIEDKVSGRIVELPLNEELRWTGLFSGDRRAAFAEVTTSLARDLENVLTEVYEDRSLVVAWGAAAREKMITRYHPEIAARQLSKIYDAALA